MSYIPVTITVPGSDTQILFNNAGALGADANLTWDYTSIFLIVGSGGSVVVKTGGDFRIFNTDDGYYGKFYISGGGQLTANRVWSGPDLDGTLAVTSQLKDADGTAGAIQYSDGSGDFNSNAGQFNYDSTTGLYTQQDITLGAAGNGIYIKEGSNATLGTATLSGGTVTVSTTKVTANSRIFAFVQTPGGTQGHLSIGTVTASTSFVINSTSGSETSTVTWWIVEPA